MKEIIQNNNQLIEWMKSVILKYCPIVDERYDIVHNYKSPELDIEIFINDNHSMIRFCFGNSTLKTSVPERIEIDNTISVNEVISFIDFILSDHEIISYFDLKKSQEYRIEDTNELIMAFSINWSEKSMKGLAVDKINFKIYFGRDSKLTKDYVGNILNRYKSLLVNSNSYKRMKNEYFSQIKEKYFKILNKKELIEFIGEMDEGDIRNILLEIDNDIFEYYFNNINTDDNIKRKRTN